MRKIAKCRGQYAPPLTTLQNPLRRCRFPELPGGDTNFFLGTPRKIQAKYVGNFMRNGPGKSIQATLVFASGARIPRPENAGVSSSAAQLPWGSASADTGENRHSAPRRTQRENPLLGQNMEMCAAARGLLPGGGGGARNLIWGCFPPPTTHFHAPRP